ncbi:MAG: putative porin, partial [Methylococcaceae bacterium]
PVRVTYIPDFVKDEIRQEVRKELRDDVVADVKAHAKEEKWGIPAALPDWVSRIRWSGDLRLRFEDNFYSSDNQAESYFDWPRINSQGGITRVDDPFRNTTVDRIRYRARARLAMEADVSNSIKAGLRINTSNDRSPVSLNQTLGQYGRTYEVTLDRVFLQNDYRDTQGRDWLTLSGGRFANPWLSTDNLFYTDVSFEGFSGTMHLPFGGSHSDPVNGALPPQQISTGLSKPNEVFMTLGYFPLQEIELTSKDKWMWGGQTGLDWVFMDDVRMRGGVGYYNYSNIQALPNSLGSRLNDWSAPVFFNKGNSLARISNDGDVNQEPRLVGLASDFNIIDAVVNFDYRAIGSTHVLFTGNYSRNLGFDQQQILRRTGENISPQVNAWQVRLDVGNPDIRKFGDWNVWLAYKYLERDSVLDAFTDSNFHLGGTDAKGWHLSGSYGLAKNTWMNVRWLATKAISGPTFDSDVLLVDLNSRF